MAAMECINEKWCDLPPELLDVVGNRLDIPSDTLHMRSVCSSWRSAVPSPPGFVLLLNSDPIKFFGPNNINLDEDYVHDYCCNLRVAKHTFFHLSPPSGAPGWLIKAEEHKPGAFHLFNPFSRTQLSKQVEANFKLDLTNVKVHELGYEYVLRNTVNVEEYSLYNMEHEKVALLKSDNLSCNSDYSLLSTHNTGKLLLYLSNLKRWSFLDDLTLGYDDRSIFVNDWSLHYVDVMEHGGTFYAVTNSGRTVAINPIPELELDSNSSSHVRVTLLTKSIIGGDKKCLVKSGDDLLMVDVYTCPTPGARLVKVHAVEIFKLDKQQQAWVLVTNLGDRALFLSNHSSFSVTASSMPACKPNSIYFHFKTLDNKDSSSSSCCTEVDTECYHNSNTIHRHTQSVWTRDEIGVFDFDKGIIGSLQEYLQDSQLFSWPPPAWVTLST